MNNIEKPFFLQGNFAPINNEGSSTLCQLVQGEIPEGLEGTLFRNGPNPCFPGVKNHWFEGDGMIHAITINQGNVSYQNHWVRTECFKLEQTYQRSLFSGFGMQKDPVAEGVEGGTANTNVVFHAGRLLALQEMSPAVALEAVHLNTLGDITWQKKAPTMSAHPHMDYETGDMFCHDYSPLNNVLKCFKWGKKGDFQSTYEVVAPYRSMMHDFAMTKNYIIYPLMPLTFDFDRLQRGAPLLMWDPDCGTHFSVQSKHHSEEVIWFKLPAFYVFHFMNAYEEGDSIVIDGMKASKPFSFPDKNGELARDSEAATYLTRWTLNLKTGEVEEEQLDDMEAEFPRFDERFTGLRYQHGYAVGMSEGAAYYDHIIHYNLATKKTTRRYLGVGRFAMEPNFVSKSDRSPEGEGYVLVLVYDESKDSSDLVILDATQIDKDPLAVIEMPHRIPFGFHGNWVANASLNNS